MSENKKGLLNENTIRRFMKLAEIDSLSDGFVSGLVQETIEEVEEVEEGMGMKAYGRDEEELEEMDHPMARDDEEPMEDAPEMEMDMDMEPAAEAPAAAGDAEAIFTSLVDKIIALAGEHGVEMSRDGGEAEEAAPEMAPEPAEDDLDMAAEPMEEAAHEEDELEEGAHEEDELEEGVDEDAMVAEITRRVSDRLQKESRNEQLAEELTEKIMARLKESTQK